MLERRDLGRLGTIFVFAVVAVLLILWRYVSLMLLTPDDLKPRAPTASVERGPILDRNGRILAIQTRLDSVTAWVPEIKDFTMTAELLADSLRMDTETLRAIFDNRPGFAYIKRKVSMSEAESVRAHMEAGRLPGIGLIEESARTYPEQQLAAPLLGIVDIDNHGLEGLELAYEKTLLPDAPPGRIIDTYGNQLFLTIDVNLQFLAEEIAGEAREMHAAESVMIVVMDARNADLLAVAVSPSFNPNSFQQFSADRRVNRPATMAYEPGSVFKVFSMATVIELGAVSPDTTFYCNGFYEHPDIPKPIACLGVHREVGLTEIIKYSCNAGAAYASELLDSDTFYLMLKSFGFGQTTTLPFPGESNGLLKSPSSWSARTKPTLAFGQELSTSAVQVVTAATTFANEGIRLQPHIVRKIVGADGKTIESFGRTPVERVTSPQTAEAMLLMMEQATLPGGTATRSRIDGVRVSAKTGTAQVFNTETGSYSDDRFIASCLALFPTDDPRVIVYVVIQNPRAGQTFGGVIAAPVVRAIGEELVSYLGIPRSGDVVVEHSGVVRVRPRPPIVIGPSMPDLSGYSKRELLPLLEIDNVSVLISGEGWVVEQSPLPGSPIGAGQRIELRLE